MLSVINVSNNNSLFSKVFISLSQFWHRKMRIFERDVIEDEDASLPEIEKPFTNEDNIISWLRKVSPGFVVDPNQVSVLYEPQEFYNMLLSLSQSAKSRISLASLYLGSGALEKKLVQTLSENLSSSKGHLQLTVLLDYNRGSRGPVSSRKILQPLVQNFPEQCHVALYHTPLLREPVRSLLPGRTNELVGLQHMKLYAFDDTIIISGANLSHDYFTNRQDRYVVVGGCAALARWAHGLVAAVAGFSLRATADGGDALVPGWHLHPFERGADPHAFARAARARVTGAAFPKDHDAGGAEAGASGGGEREDEGGGSPGATWVFPLLQMAQLGLRHDGRVTTRLLAAAPPGGRLALATGYFNPPAEYADALLRRCRAHCALLAAHPSASGFAGASGPAGAIPAAYAALAADFAQRLLEARGGGECGGGGGGGAGGGGGGGEVALGEYAREGWTFHAKGLWLTLPAAPDAAPALTLVGSPNFGARSFGRDLEVQFAVVARDARLRAALAKERDRLYARAQPIAPQASARSAAPLWVRLVVGLARDFF